ncbi:hypothetical protein MA16_Dca022642 [Dendrobium catenatum]|uniref:Uncharacterized protein n=1 Tax=Dendrobium catenatum TaxID=906689 RepID=A0A2I0VC48_9ASPA|nr:hypothetical protein MA16_Dca022642 [Dendrobium catenatum]
MVKLWASGGGPAEAWASGGVLVEHRTSSGGSAEVRASSDGAAEQRRQAEVRGLKWWFDRATTSSGGPAEVKASSGCPRSNDVRGWSGRAMMIGGGPAVQRRQAVIRRRPCHSRKSINRPLILLEKDPSKKSIRDEKEEEKEGNEEAPPRPPPEPRWTIAEASPDHRRSLVGPPSELHWTTTLGPHLRQRPSPLPDHYLRPSPSLEALTFAKSPHLLQRSLPSLAALTFARVHCLRQRPSTSPEALNFSIGPHLLQRPSPSLEVITFAKGFVAFGFAPFPPSRRGPLPHGQLLFSASSILLFSFPPSCCCLSVRLEESTCDDPTSFY